MLQTDKNDNIEKNMICNVRHKIRNSSSDATDDSVTTNAASARLAAMTATTCYSYYWGLF